MLQVETTGSHPLFFNPQNHKLAGINKRAAKVPTSEHGQHIVRWIHQLDLETALETINNKRRHFDALARIGEVAIPKQADFIGEIPRVGTFDPESYKHKVAVFSVVPYYENIKRVRNGSDARKVASMLHGYNEWLNDNHESQLLYDIFTLRQYGITDQGVTLLDVEPRMFTRYNSAGEAAPANIYVQDQIDKLEQYLD